MSDDVKVPTIVDVTADNEWQRIHLYNQERMISQGDAMEDALKGLLETQRHMAEFAAKLSVNMDVLDETLKESSRTMSGFVTQIAKVPVVIVLIGLASWAFYLEKLSEKGWMFILAIATFPYLGDGIVAILKIVRGQNGGGGPTAK